MPDIRRIVQYTQVRNGVPNPSGEADATYWSATSGAGSMSAPTSVAGSRPGSLSGRHIESTGTGVTAAAGAQVRTSTSPACAPGQRVYAYAWGKVGTTSTSLRLDIAWLDSASAVLSTSTIQTQASPVTGTWYELQGAATAPASTAFARLSVWMNNSTTTPQVFADDCLLVIDPTYTGGYFEGSGQYATVIKDLELSQTYNAIRGTFAIQPPSRNTVSSGPSRRYAGTTAISETHGNGTISWDAWVQGTTYDLVCQNVENMIAAVEPLGTPGLHLEWRPNGATYSTFYEIRGPANWVPQYRSEQFAGGKAMKVQVQIPVAPLGKGDRTWQTIQSFTAPNVVSLSAAVGGTAPAEAAITINKANGQPTAPFGLIAWWTRLPTAPSGYNPVFGIIEGEATLSGGTLTTWANTAVGTARGGNRLDATVTTTGTATAQYGITTAGLTTGSTVEVEVWARVHKSNTIVSPRCTVSAFGSGGSGARIYTREWGAAGKPMTVPASQGYGLTRLGTLSLPLIGVDNRWTLNVDYSWATSASSAIALDYLVLVPAKQRACSPTGENLDTSFPRYLPSGTGQATKTLYSDLSGTLTTGGVTASDAGLGGAAIELPPGNVDLLVWLSDTMVDLPSGGTEANSKEWLTTVGSLAITPRYFLVKGA